MSVSKNVTSISGDFYWLLSLSHLWRWRTLVNLLIILLCYPNLFPLLKTISCKQIIITNAVLCSIALTHKWVGFVQEFNQFLDYIFPHILQNYVSSFQLSFNIITTFSLHWEKAMFTSVWLFGFQASSAVLDSFKLKSINSWNTYFFGRTWFICLHFYVER